MQYIFFASFLGIKSENMQVKNIYKSSSIFQYLQVWQNLSDSLFFLRLNEKH